MLFGIEQEYVFVNPVTGNPYSWDEYDGNTPRPQGEYYCGVGSSNTVCRDIVQAHAEACLHTELNYEGSNAEVMLSQWEYQIGTCSAVDVSDDIIMSRYLLQRVAEHFGVGVSYDPKPVEGDWNGSGAHINFSTKHLREEGGQEYIDSLCEALEDTHDEHISVYGTGNERRLTGEHETSPIDSYSWGTGDRGASVRIPAETALKGKGYLEDRRPAANIDPYEAVYKLTDTVLKLHDKINSFKGQLVDVTA
jgi:glutamine synthetase